MDIQAAAGAGNADGPKMLLGEVAGSNTQDVEDGDSLKPHEIEYKYKPLGSGPSIRLVVLLPGKGKEIIRCRLIPELLSSELHYEALSYAWGDSSKSCKILCDTQPLYVTSSLHCALRHFRHATADRILWVDAICIDQKNPQERSQQVQLMGQIYALTQHVLVWIGEDSENLSDSFRVVEELHTFLIENEEGYPDNALRFDHLPEGRPPIFSKLLATTDKWAGSFIRLISRPWFSRRWVIQEIAKAPRATVVCGREFLSWNILANVYWSLYSTGLLGQVWASQTNVPGELTNIRAIATIANMELIRRDAIRGNFAPLLESVISTRVFECTDSRDVLYSLLGLAADVGSYGERVIPDYKLPVAEVYRRFVIGCIMGKGSLLSLSTLYIPPASPSLDLPTWVPDFSDLQDANPLMHQRIGTGLPYRASGSSQQCVRLSIDEKILYAWGKAVDVVTKTGLAIEEIPFVDDAEDVMLQRTRDWLSLCENIASFGTVDHSMTADRFEAFWRTMLLNLTANWDLAPPEYSGYFQQFLDFVLNRGATTPQGPQNLLMENLSQIENALYLHGVGWRMCVTKNGRLGKVLKSVEVGDVICVLYGGEVPYVIRPSVNGHYKFIGSCYIHGLMDGEACQMEELKPEEFSFC
ncbi:hypothetical protein V493_03716 [Pseudogymnoascus sp. VKM F-4281 (FW-2241)]|nr:hypothetical protein V493_03716 [Pseudogymnoascus sp. VKM F-4281 (FW-2241)]